MFGKFLISFDVESLFTNIPLEECIDLAVKYISEGNPDLQLTPSDLKRPFSFAAAETHFLFKGSFYDQMDGVAMGSPLAPVLANLFMGHHEKKSNIEVLRFFFIVVMWMICFVYSIQNKIPLHFLTISIVNIPIYALWWRKKSIMFCPF